MPKTWPTYQELAEELACGNNQARATAYFANADSRTSSMLGQSDAMLSALRAKLAIMTPTAGHGTRMLPDRFGGQTSRG